MMVEYFNSVDEIKEFLKEKSNDKIEYRLSYYGSRKNYNKIEYDNGDENVMDIMIVIPDIYTIYKLVIPVYDKLNFNNILNYTLNNLISKYFELGGRSDGNKKKKNSKG